ncbi:hypothetical protein AB0I94_41265 [Streptomyces sp. NPDC050147]|uniref:hypothetical protein n=1 Tax=Streptomyces sp. NPDC050147 TaxID=3155513 RepID=UPI00344ABB67
MPVYGGRCPRHFDGLVEDRVGVSGAAHGEHPAYVRGVGEPDDMDVLALARGEFGYDRCG